MFKTLEAYIHLGWPTGGPLTLDHPQLPPGWAIALVNLLGLVLCLREGNSENRWGFKTHPLQTQPEVEKKSIPVLQAVRQPPKKAVGCVLLPASGTIRDLD